MVWLDTMSGPDPDYYVLVRSVYGNHLAAALFRKRVSRDQHVARVAVSHPDGRTLSVSIPLSRMGFDPGRAYYRWSAESIWNDVHCPNACFDKVDDAGSIPEARP